MDNAYVKAGISHTKQTYTYQVPNYADSSAKLSDTAYELSLGKEFGEYDAGLTLNKAKDSDVSYTLYGNKDFGNINVGLAYDLPVTTTYTEPLNANITTKNKASSIGASVTYNFDKNTALTPFVAASITRYSNKMNRTENTTGGTDGYSYNYLNYGVMAGAKYELTPNVTLDGGVSYFKSNDFKFVVTTNSYDGYGINAGVKYQF